MTCEQLKPFSSSVQTLIIPSLSTNLLVHTQHKERTVTAIKLKETKENNYNNNKGLNRNSRSGVSSTHTTSILIASTYSNSKLTYCVSQQHLENINQVQDTVYKPSVTSVDEMRKPLASQGGLCSMEFNIFMYSVIFIQQVHSFSTADNSLANF